MDKYEKIGEVFNLSNMAFRKLMDLKDDLRKELKDLLISEGVKDIDQLEDVEEYGKALILDDQMEKLSDLAENLNDFIDDLIKLKL